MESLRRVPTTVRRHLALWRFSDEEGMPVNDMYQSLRHFFGGFKDALRGPVFITAMPIGSTMDVHDMLWIEFICLIESKCLTPPPSPPPSPRQQPGLLSTVAGLDASTSATAALVTAAAGIVVKSGNSGERGAMCRVDDEYDVIRQARLDRVREGAARLALAHERTLSTATTGNPVGACADGRCAHSLVLDSAPYIRTRCSAWSEMKTQLPPLRETKAWKEMKAQRHPCVVSHPLSSSSFVA